MRASPQRPVKRPWSGPMRPFLATSFQSAIGSEMAYVGLLLLVYAQTRSSWAITALLVAEFVPTLLLANAAGALADRRSRRSLVVAADVARCLAFVGLAFSPSIAATLVLATVVSVAQTVFRPASRASVPSLAGHERIDSAMGALSFVNSIAGTAGPLIAAAILLAGGPATVMLVNAATFLISAIVLARLPLDAPRGADLAVACPDKGVDHAGDASARPPNAGDASDESAVIGGARRTLTILGGLGAVPAVIIAGFGATLAFAMINVAEPLLVRDTLGGDESAFALLVGLYGAGATIGSALARTELRFLFVAGGGSVLAVGVTALAPTVPIAGVLFVVGGVFNGLYLTSEDRLLSALVPQEVQGRVYGFRDALESAAFLGAYAAAGAIAALSGPRAVFLVSAATALVLGLAALRFLTGDRSATASTQGDPRDASDTRDATDPPNQGSTPRISDPPAESKGPIDPNARAEGHQPPTRPHN